MSSARSAPAGHPRKAPTRRRTWRKRRNCATSCASRSRPSRSSSSSIPEEEKMKSILALIIFCASAASAAEALRPAGRTELPGYTGDFDHFEYDLATNRLWLAAEDHGTLDLFDLKSGKL